jgi:hypothetical protein
MLGDRALAQATTSYAAERVAVTRNEGGATDR